MFGVNQIISNKSKVELTMIMEKARDGISGIAWIIINISRCVLDNPKLMFSLYSMHVFRMLSDVPIEGILHLLSYPRMSL
jgi:hypothetical protein